MKMAIVADEMARANAPAPINGLGIGFIGPTIIIHGTDAQKQRYLKKILTAEEIWCQLYSEPNSGSDLASLRTRAEDKGDHFLVNGQKIWTSGGHISDWGILLARTDPAVAKHKGISCFLLDMRQPGVEVRPLKQITGSAEFNEVFMTNARVEKSDLIGRLGQGWEIAQTTLGFERGGNSIARVTRYASAFDRLLEAARKLRRAGKPLLEDPVVRAKLGRVYAEMEVQRYAALRVLSALQKGDSPGAASSITKLSYSEFEKRYYELCLEILGPYGQVTDGGSATTSSAWRSSGPTDRSRTVVWRSRASTSTRRQACGPAGRTRSCGRARAPSTPARRRSRRTSSASACSASPRRSGPIASRGSREAGASPLSHTAAGRREWTFRSAPISSC
jgi:alkylation response protein AidB-like acyl-CoA dehydrogenase